MGDCEDPEIYAAAPLLDFEKSEKGQWLKERALEKMHYNLSTSYETYGYNCTVWAKLNEEDAVFYNLKYN